jgi:hypothetical protein
MRQPWRLWLIRLCDLGSWISEWKLFHANGRLPRPLGAMVKAAAEKWWPIIKALGLKTE